MKQLQREERIRRLIMMIQEAEAEAMALKLHGMVQLLYIAKDVCEKGLKKEVAAK